MQLTATGVTLPNNDWKIQSFKEYKMMSEETMAFSAVLVHIPTKVKFTLKNDGHGGSSFRQRYDADRDKYIPVEKAWEEFVLACRPALQATVAHEESYADLYDNMEFYGLEDSVISLFTEEMAYRKDLAKADVKACVRNETHGPNEFDIYNVSPETLKTTGKVQGVYWDKKAENWLPL